MRKIIDSAAMTHRVQNWLASSDSARILHVFDHACNLINERNETLSIVTQKIDEGPFNLVIGNEINFTDHLTAQSPVSKTLTALYLEDLTIHWGSARLWNSQPKWKMLHSQRDKLCKQVQQLPNTNYLTSPRTSGVANSSVLLPILHSSHSLASSLATAQLPSSIAAVKRLAGSGIGLTPSGDDYIMGAMYAAWIIHSPEAAQEITRQIAEAAARLTTSLSGAWLLAASNGEAGILWHKFFDALITGEATSIQRQVSAILSVGATSGADALAGFFDTIFAFMETGNKHVISSLV